MHDSDSEKLAAAIKKVFGELRGVHEKLTELHSDTQKQIKAITKAQDSNNKGSTPQKLTATVDFDESIKDEKRKANCQQSRYQRGDLWGTWAGVIAVLVYTGITFGLWNTAKMTMLIGERPWTTIPMREVQIPVPEVDKDLAQELPITNEGKTVARNVHTSFVIRLIPGGIEPDFSYTNPDYLPDETDVGTIFPSDTNRKIRVARVKYDTRPNRNGLYKRPKVTTPLLKEEFDSLAIGNSYIAIYGLITYDDSFGVGHWTRYCQAGRLVVKGTFFPSNPSKTCVAYNDADNKY